jgi:hypothetical protein
VRIDPDECRDPDLLAAEVRRLRAIIAAGETTFNDEDRTPQAHATPSEDSVQEEFTDIVFKTLVERISLTQSLLDENERLREAIRRLADQDATLSVRDGNVTVTLDATLTDEERAAIEWAACEADVENSATLRNLLERLHT